MFNAKLTRHTKSHDQLAREIADRSLAAVLGNLGSQADTMCGAELRGYIRAHAFPCVYAEAAKLTGNVWPQETFNQLVASALELATHSLQRRLKSHPVVVVPLPHVRLRIAA